jgi:hypothetical protein
MKGAFSLHDTLAAPAQTYATAPEVDVTAADLNGFGPATTVALDEAVNGGAWTPNYATGTLFDGAVAFTGYTPLPTGTVVDFRARERTRSATRGRRPPPR